MFKLKTDFQPQGDQPQAIKGLIQGIEAGKPAQVLLGVTGSGKTFTVANVVEAVQKPTLVLAHNKTLAAQLYAEFKTFFPENAVEYFVSYYDYYQPEAYIARTDTYIEKDLAINDKIDKMRLSATRSLIERSDVLIVSSVSCIYGLGMPEYYARMNLTLEIGQECRWDELLLHLVEMHYKRNDWELRRGTFRSRGEALDILPAYEEDKGVRIQFVGGRVERISEIDPLTTNRLAELERITIYPASHHVTPEQIRLEAVESIKVELKERVAFFEAQGKGEEARRLMQRTLYDLEMIREIGFCKGIENYSRHFSRRAPGEPPPCLLDYFPKDFLLVVDESHQMIPQLHAMYNGDRARKEPLVEFGFRLPSAFDNRPLKFFEVYDRMEQVVYVSATPGEFEISEARGEIVEQVIRPTGLLDPAIEVRPASNQIDDCLEEIRLRVSQGSRVLVTTLTKRLSEELTRYLKELGVNAKYLHSDITTLERIQIIRDLRLGVFDVLVGINLLREGLDIPEVSLVAILDADKEGFLRSTTSLIQTCGRAARNAEGRVIIYADKQTASIKETLRETDRRRALQARYNEEHGITPTTIVREITVELPLREALYEEEEEKSPYAIKEEEHPYLSPKEVKKKISEHEALMKEAAKEYRFEEAAHHRDLMRKFQQLELAYL